MTRLGIITGILAKNGIDGLLVSNMKNIRYLSGFTGSSAFLLLGKTERLFVTDSRYTEQAAAEVSGYKIHTVHEAFHAFLMEQARLQGMQILGFETSASYSFYHSLLRKGVRLKAVSGVIEEVRRIKEQKELNSLCLAVRRAEKAFREIRPLIRPGRTERQVALQLEERLKKNGCRALPFDIIVAAGKNSAMPHAKPSDNRIRPGDFVVIDWGGEAEGYFSDMTRTLIMKGRDMSKKLEIYSTVLEANLTAIHEAKAGCHARAVDKAARDIIKKAGYGDFFGHGTGHGVGLDVHELPRVSRTGKEVIKPGMVFTVEPGIYIPGVGGVRIEDMVHVRKDGPDILTSLRKALEIIN